MNLKIEYVSGGSAWCFCPWHKDINTPNLSITLKGKWAGYWKCWACGRVGNIAPEDTVEGLKLDNEVRSSPPRTRWDNLMYYYKRMLNKYPLAKIEFANTLDVSMSVLDNTQVGFTGDSWTIPMWKAGYVSGIQKQYRGRKKQSIHGSHIGMFLNDYVEYEYEDCVFICEGYSDTAAVLDLGYTAMGIPCCGYNINEVECLIDYYICDKEDDRYLCIIPDNNKESELYSMKLCEQLEDANYEVSMFDVSPAKDIRELIQLKGKDEVRKQLGVYC